MDECKPLDVGAVDEALRGGAEIDSRAESGTTPLIAAVMAQQVEVAAHLLVAPAPASSPPTPPHAL